MKQAATVAVKFLKDRYSNEGVEWGEGGSGGNLRHHEGWDLHVVELAALFYVPDVRVG